MLAYYTEELQEFVTCMHACVLLPLSHAPPCTWPANMLPCHVHVWPCPTHAHALAAAAELRCMHRPTGSIWQAEIAAHTFHLSIQKPCCVLCLRAATHWPASSCIVHLAHAHVIRQQTFRQCMDTSATAAPRVVSTGEHQLLLALPRSCAADLVVSCRLRAPAARPAAAGRRAQDWDER